MQHRENHQLTVHASCVAIGRSAALLMGESGAGKSSVALEMMARGAVLVADDQTILTSDGTVIIASCPPPLRGKIEARGIGLINAEYQANAVVQFVVDLDSTEKERMPPAREIELLNQCLPLLHGIKMPHFPAALIQVLKGGRID